MDTNSSMQQKLSPQAVQDGVTGGYEAATCSSYCCLGRSIPKCSGGSIEGPAAGDRLGRHSSDLPRAGSGGAGVSIMNDDLLLRPTVHHLCNKKSPLPLHEEGRKGYSASGPLTSVVLCQERRVHVILVQHLLLSLCASYISHEPFNSTLSLLRNMVQPHHLT